MGRNLGTPGLPVTDESATILHFMQFDFAGDIVRLCTAPHNMSWNTYTWQGIGGNLGFNTITETTDLSGHNAEFVLSGVEQNFVSIILTQKYIGREMQAWVTHIDPTTPGAGFNDPVCLFRGRMNGGFEVEEDRPEDRPGTVTVRGRFVDLMGDMQQVKGVMTNLESHQKVAPGDLLFKDVANIAGKIKAVFWGKK